MFLAFPDAAAGRTQQQMLRIVRVDSDTRHAADHVDTLLPYV